MSNESVVKIDAKLVKELRDKSGAPRATASRPAGVQGRHGRRLRRAAQARYGLGRQEGLAFHQRGCGRYLYPRRRQDRVLLELNCESDFVARTEDFQELLKDIAMHIAATDPRYIGKEEVTEADLEREKEIYRAQAAATGKPPAIIEKMLEGKLGKFYEEFCLLEQPFIKEQTQSIAQIIATKVGKLGENISVRRFARFKIGDPNFTVASAKVVAEEVAQA